MNKKMVAQELLKIAKSLIQSSLSFEDWMKAVDKEVNKRIGLSSSDLPDIAYADMHQDGVSPVSAAKKAIRGAAE